MLTRSARECTRSVTSLFSKARISHRRLFIRDGPVVRCTSSSTIARCSFTHLHIDVWSGQLFAKCFCRVYDTYSRHADCHRCPALAWQLMSSVREMRGLLTDQMVTRDQFERYHAEYLNFVISTVEEAVSPINHEFDDL